MQLILITGLDGSGKSTLLDKLEASVSEQSIAFLRVPKIDAVLFKQNKELYETALFINRLHVDADTLKTPQLKVIALFSSMLLFKELLNELLKKKIEIVFCERHPLIDTAVYVKFYIDKMDPNKLPKDLLTSMEKEFDTAIAFLLQLVDIPVSPHGKMQGLLEYIHDWFAIKKKDTLPDLQQLFKVELPYKIIYLSAEPATLMQRLVGRKVLEAHESVEVFSKLVPAYDQVLKGIGVEVEKIDANSIASLDEVLENIKLEYF